MSRYEHGRIIAVNEVRFGSNLVADHAAGVTSLTVEDAADFDETGGQLTINGQVIDYTGFNDDTGTITLASGQSLTAAAEDGDRVDLYDPLYGGVSAEKVAQVQLDGEDDTNTDPLEATVAMHLQGALPEGVRGTTGESVLLEVDGDEWRLVDVLGTSATLGGGMKFHDLDTFTAPVDGAQAFTLSHTPIAGSVHMAWGGLWQPHTEFTVTGSGVTVPDPSGLILAGDVLDFRYAYRDTTANPTADYGPVPTCYLGITMTGGHIAGGTGTYSVTVTQANGVELGVVEQLSGGTYRAYFTHVGYPLSPGQTSISWPIANVGMGATPGATPVGLYMRYTTGGSDPAGDRGTHDPARCCFYFGAAWLPGNTPGGPLT